MTLKSGHSKNRVLSSVCVLVASVAMVISLVSVAGASGEELPVKEKLSSFIGWEVDKTTNGKVCFVESGDECVPGVASNKPGGFEDPRDVAVNEGPETSSHFHHVYVIDLTHRIQEFGEDGQFIGTFGWGVNETKDKEAGATQAQKNVCTAVSGDVCTVGVPGNAPGQFDALTGVVVDPANGDIYVAESDHGSNGYGERIQKFTSSGEFVLEIGKEVNEATKSNLCTVEEGKCGGPALGSFAEGGVGTNEQGAFSFATSELILSFGGPEGLLYVGENGRVQKLATDGKYQGEIPLESISSLNKSRVGAIAVGTSGEVYLIYREFYEEINGKLQHLPAENANVVYGVNPNGKIVDEFTARPIEPTGTLEIMSLAIDPSGRLAVTETESYNDIEHHELTAHRGRLYHVGAGHMHVVSEFADPAGLIGGNEVGVNSLAFSDKGAMYGTDFLSTPTGAFAHELIAYEPVSIAELSTTVANCDVGTVSGTNVTFDCGLNGEINPEGVSGTVAWFQWGLTPALDATTPPQQICSTSCGVARVPLSPALVDGLRPNETVFYEVAGEDANTKRPELMTSETISFKTPTVPPRILGEPTASFVRAFSAVFSGEVNPENADSRYFFEYAPEANPGEILAIRCPLGLAKESCDGVSGSPTLELREYGRLSATLEARGLQPATTYRYRLMAINEGGEVATNEVGDTALPEGTFTTAPAPAPFASTAGSIVNGPTSATVTGTVNPDGQPAAYEFEVGVNKGHSTQYGVVFSGDAGAGAVPVEEVLTLTGLQPGTEYAYRIVASNAFGTSFGTPMVLTTAGLPEALPVSSALAQLPVPGIRFPATSKGKPKPLTTAQKLQKALSACRVKPRSRRRACEHQAHKKYGPKVRKTK